MNNKLTLTIETIKSKSVEQFDEAAIKQTVILKLLSDLGWDTFNRDEVFPEFSTENRKVDYALRINNKNKVFIEAKRGNEELDKHQKQLLDYSFAEGVTLAILTNGTTWWFYLPIKEGEWTKRKFYTIDFKSQSEIEILEKLISFLAKKNILSGESIRTAEETLKSKTKERAIEESLPVVWRNLLANPSSEFIQLFAEETKKHCGFRPTDEYVVKFLNNNEEIREPENEQYEDNLTIDLPIKNIERAGHTRLKVILPNGQIINEHMAMDTFIKTIQAFGIDQVKQLKVIRGALLISDKQLNVGEKKKYKQIPNTSFYININHGTPKKKEYLEKIAQMLDKKITVQIEDRK